jgi:uncharacterized protein
LSDFRPAYLDTSAILKLIVPEPETQALWEWLQGWPDQFTSSLARVEIARALVRRKASPRVTARAEAVLSRLVTVHLDAPTLTTAARLKDPLLRALDAIHLGAALSIGDVPAAFVTYDDRLAQAARRLRLAVAQPVSGSRPNPPRNPDLS